MHLFLTATLCSRNQHGPHFPDEGTEDHSGMCTLTLGHWYKHSMCMNCLQMSSPGMCLQIHRDLNVCTHVHSDQSSLSPEETGPATHVHKHTRTQPTISDTHICTLTQGPLLQTQICTKGLQQNTCWYTHTHLHAHPRAPTTCFPEAPSAGISLGNILRCSLFLELLAAGASPCFLAS